MENRPKGQAQYAILLFIFSGALYFLDTRGWLKQIRGFAQRPIVAVEKKIYSARQSLNFLSKAITNRRLLEDEFLRVQSDFQKLAVDQNELSSCLEENEKMRRLLGTPLSPKWKYLPAKVAGVSGLMRIDKGEKDGVKAGMIVVSENILVGRIVTVGENDSLVQLPVTPGVKILVSVKNLQSDRIAANFGIQARGLLLGQYGGGLVLDRVLQEEDIQKGDFVVTSGDENWPADLLIGEIAEVLPKSAEIYRKAQVKPLVDYSRLNTIFVVVSR